MNLEAYASDFPQQGPTAAESVSRVLRQAILDGALAGGSMLRQAELAKTFGVSRVPIREALLKLEGDGLVETHPFKGVIVTTLSTGEFEEILEMRLALETLALKLAAPRFKPEDTAAARALLETAGEGLKSSAPVDLRKQFESRWGDLNWEFHRRLYAPAGRPRLLATIENLNQLFARHLRMRVAGNEAFVGPADGTPEEAMAENLKEWAGVLEEHRLMLDACDRHDAKAACAVLKRHISDHGAELVRRLRATASAAIGS